MKITEKYRPLYLRDIVGQPAITFLQAITRRPRECCVLLVGPPGTGKTTGAFALARELGAEDEYSGRHVVVSANLMIDECRQMFERTLRVTPLWSETGWKCLVIEELEALPSQTVARYLKVALEQLPPHTVVAATSNDTTGIDKALLQRFKVYSFAGGPVLALSAAARLAEIWQRETEGAALPPGWQAWGWRADEFSLRVAFDELEDALEVCVSA